MTKQQLIEYLEAVCDAESALQASSDMLKQLKHSLYHEIQFPPRPQEPKKYIVPESNYTPPHYVIKDRFGTARLLFLPITFVVAFLIAGLICLLNPEYESTASNQSIILIVICSFFISLVLCFCIVKALVNSDNKHAATHSKEEYQQAVAINEHNYNSKMQTYMEEMKQFERRYILVENVQSSLKRLVDIEYDRKSSIEDILTDLYSKGIIHPNFRNIIAVYQLHDYLTTNICEGLEGPNGAYAQYMQDVRVKRICDSIDTLKDSLEASFAQLQNSLVTELSKINGNIDTLSYNLHKGFRALSVQLTDDSNATRTLLEDKFNIANRHLSNIETCSAITAHNLYISQHMHNIDAYMLSLL